MSRRTWAAPSVAWGERPWRDSPRGAREAAGDRDRGHPEPTERERLSMRVVAIIADTVPWLARGAPEVLDRIQERLELELEGRVRTRRRRKSA